MTHPTPSPKSAQHTPGPWQNDPLQPTIWTADGETKIATIDDLPWVNGKSDWITEQANARLIAAAPELLAALRAVEWVSFPGSTVPQCPWCRRGMAGGHRENCQRQAAIARAEGREG